MISQFLLSHFDPDSLIGKLVRLDWIVIIIATMIAATGLALLYSAAGGHMAPWAKSQLFNLAICVGVTFCIALFNLKILYFFAPILYLGSICLLILVEIKGHTGMGAQRWLDLGVIKVQPSEFAKIGVVLCLAYYYHRLTFEQARHPFTLIFPILITLLPVGLVIFQPNLGTATLIFINAAVVAWMAGVRVWIFVSATALLVASTPIVWWQLHDYQKSRVETFLNPEQDPLGAGYNIIQSKIAFGNGGLTGQGFLEGSQSQLRFLPEKHTDFIVTVLGEEFGLIGSLALIALYTTLIVYGWFVAATSISTFTKLASAGLAITMFLYMFTNIAMASGLIPVVGIPLPLVSYGGTAALTFSCGLGLLLNFRLNRDVNLPK